MERTHRVAVIGGGAWGTALAIHLAGTGFEVNLWMLDLVLLAILLLPKYPIIAGTAVALGAHLKLFSLVLLPVWLLLKQWRGITSALLTLTIL